MSAAGRPTASPRAHPVRRSATGFKESTVASRSTMINAWGNWSKAWSESVRSLAMSPQYRRAQTCLQLLQSLLGTEAPRSQHPFIETDVADGLSAKSSLEPVEPKPGMVGRGFLRNPPPVIGVAAKGSKVEHRPPVQEVVRHQLALAVGGAAEQVAGGL